MNRIPRRGSYAISVLAALALLTGCSNSSPEATAPPTTGPSEAPSLSQFTATPPPQDPTASGGVTSTPTSTPGADPASLPPVPYPGIEVGETVPIDFGVARIAMVPWSGEAVTVAEVEHPRTPVLLYDTSGDELWMLDGTAAFGLVFSPFGEQAIASAFWQVAQPDQGSAEPETVLVDLESMTVRRLLPVSAQGAYWASPTLLRLVLRPNQEHDRPHDWRPGIYEVDLEANTVTFVDSEELVSLSPDGALALLTLPPRTDPDRLVARDVASGVDITIHRFTEGDHYSSETWVRAQNRLFFAVSGQRYYSWAPGEPAAKLVHERDAFGQFLPSPGGSHVAVAGPEGTSVVDLEAGTTVGPYAAAFPAAWHPTQAGTLMLIEDYCQRGPEAGRLATLDLATQTLTPVADDLHRFLTFYWSGRGEEGVGWSTGGVYLIDVASGSYERLDWAAAFEDSQAPIMPWMDWSADGRWLYANGNDHGHEMCSPL